jgi:predicted DNA repair protein MutK
MATSLLALLDDITSVLDDVATMTKVATKKTAGVLSDDLALNAEQVTGVRPDRELPVVWAVAKGSLVNKAILVPLALLLSAFAPWAVTPLMIAGGLFLCFEGAEKLLHKLLHLKDDSGAERAQLRRAVVDPTVNVVAVEKRKIKGAIRTDFILSAEIIVIALGTVTSAPLLTRVVVLVSIGLLMTVGVYGIVAGIVKLDDGALALMRNSSGMLATIGRNMLKAMPWFMKGLSVVGTAAMFLVGGGILVHGLPWLHHVAEGVLHAIEGSGAALVKPLLNLLTGVAAGSLLVVAAKLFQGVRDRAGVAGD